MTPSLQTNTFTHSDNLTTFYWSAGPVDGPLVIFIHGWPANGETWKPQLLALAALGFRAIAPDTRGYGRSSVPKDTNNYAAEHHVSDMVALLSHLGRRKAVWIGHDWGAGLVTAFAGQRPDLCVGVCLMTVPYWVIFTGIDGLASLRNRDLYPESEYPLAQWDYMAFHVENPEASASQLGKNVPNTIKALYRPGGPEGYGKPAFTSQMRKLGGWWGGAPEAPDTPFEGTFFGQNQNQQEQGKQAFERMVAEFQKNGFEGPNAYYHHHERNKAYMKTAPNGGRLPSSVPVLFVGAKWDYVCDTASSRLSEPMREMCEDLTEVTIDAGHWVSMQKPEETSAAIVRWIATKMPSYFPGFWKTPFVTKG